MANTDQNITELPIKTASEVLDEDYMLGIDLVEGYQVSTKDFADYAVNRAAISIGGKTQTTASAISEVRTTAGNAQPKESGKGLSTNDFTNAYKSKLDGIAAGAEVNVQSDWNASSGDAAILHKPTTISGYGITDAYTKTQVDTSLATKSDKATTYTKSDVDAIVNTDDDTSEAANPLVIETDAAQYAKNTHLTLEPVQDLHGYDHPWPAGGGKNLLDDSAKEVGTFSGVTVSQNSKGQFILNGTATANNNVKVGVVTLPAGSYIFSGMKSTGSSSTFFLNLEPQWNGTSNQNLYSGEYSGTSDAERMYTARIYFRSGQSFSNTIFEPMLRKSTDSADFAPYSNICPITPMGHRNLLPHPYRCGEIARTEGGVYISEDVNGVITLNGTATSNGIVYLSSRTDGPLSLPIGSYILSGIPTGYESYNLRLGFNRGSNTATIANDTGNGATIVETEGGAFYGFWLAFNSGATFDNVKIKPMIRPASDLNSTFVPYGVTRVVAKVTGKNMLNWKEFVRGSVTGTGADSESYNRLRSPFARVMPLTAYTYSTNSNILVYEIEFYDKNGNWIGYRGVSNTSGTVTTDQDTRYIKVLLRRSDNSVITVDEGEGFQMELGSTDTTYDPYISSEVSVDLPEPVYGGTLDLETGELVADMALADMGADFAYVRNTSYANPFFQATLSTADENKSSLTTIYKYGSFTETVANDKTYTIVTNTLRIRDEDYDDATAFRNAMRGQKIAFHLKTPITYQLTPQQLALFKGINNISANAKTVQVTYRNGELATTGNIVDAVEVAKQNAIGESASYTDDRLATELAPILGNLATAETSPAIASHAVGEYLLYNGNLYKVLAAISAGQQLTIGTNIGQTNVAAELASQASAISVLNSNLPVTVESDEYDATFGHVVYSMIKINKICCVSIQYTPNVNITSSSGILKNSANILPVISQIVPVYEADTGYMNQVIRADVSTPNRRAIYNKDSESTGIFFLGSYEKDVKYNATFCYVTSQ